jgi:hypothetical protein
MTLEEFEIHLREYLSNVDHNDGISNYGTHYIITLLTQVEPEEDRDFLTIKYSEYLT